MSVLNLNEYTYTLPQNITLNEMMRLLIIGQIFNVFLILSSIISFPGSGYLLEGNLLSQTQISFRWYIACRVGKMRVYRWMCKSRERGELHHNPISPWGLLLSSFLTFPFTQATQLRCYTHAFLFGECSSLIAPLPHSEIGLWCMLFEECQA